MHNFSVRPLETTYLAWWQQPVTWRTGATTYNHGTTSTDYPTTLSLIEHGGTCPCPDWFWGGTGGGWDDPAALFPPTTTCLF